MPVGRGHTAQMDVRVWMGQGHIWASHKRDRCPHTWTRYCNELARVGLAWTPLVVCVTASCMYAERLVAPTGSSVQPCSRPVHQRNKLILGRSKTVHPCRRAAVSALAR